MKIRYAVHSVIGRRNSNQDNFLADGTVRKLSDKNTNAAGVCGEPHQLYAVCDGMGGEEAGEKASCLAVKTLKCMDPEFFFSNSDRCINRINEEINCFQKKMGCSSGTTIAGICISGRKMIVFNVGDTRVYCLHHGKPEQITKDHTEFQGMVDAGLLRAEDYHSFRRKGVLTQYLGINTDEMLMSPFISNEINLEHGDQYLICSDGLYGSVEKDEIERIVNSESELSIICEKLILKANEMKSSDNITVMLLEAEEDNLEDPYDNTVDRQEKKGLFDRILLNKLFHMKNS